MSRPRVPVISRRRAAVLALLAGFGLVAVAASGSAEALPAQTTFVQQSFTGSTVDSGFGKPAAPGASNGACLTAGVDTSATPIPACGGTPDADGSGALRLTDVFTFEAGGVASTVTVPMSHGLDVSFNSYQYGGGGADGLTFFLAAADPSHPLPTTAIGQFGGSLGYSDQTPNLNGLANGYLGFGLDAYGNFPYPSFGSPECASVAQSPNTITVRGPGNAQTGYCVLDQHPVTAGALRSNDSTRSSADVVPVEVVVNPSAAPTTALVSGVSVPANSYAVIVTAIGSVGPTDVLTGALPSTLNGKIPAGLYNSSWIDPATGYPSTLTFGWTAGTGGAGDNHEITNVSATTLLGAIVAAAPAATGLPLTGSSFSVSLAGLLGGALLAGGLALIIARRRPWQGSSRQR